MKILVSPDSFKEAMKANNVAESMKQAIERVKPEAEVELLPVADGGEGTMEILTLATGGVIYNKTITDPLGETIEARYAILGDQKTAIVEMAEASGLQLLKKRERNPLRTTTYGTGELIRATLSHSISRLIVTIGGSATNDGGVGMLQALGVKVLNANGSQIDFGGDALSEINKVDFSNLDERLKTVEISVACDVTNPLTGENGASKIFGPQKGATEQMVVELDKSLKIFNQLLEKETNQHIGEIPGAGAAGGLGAGLIAIGGKLYSGIDLVLDILRFSDKLEQVDYVFTGEGKIDSQTLNGKVISGIITLSKLQKIPVIAFAGSVQSGYEPMFEQGLLSVHSITQYPCSLKKAIASTEENLIQTVQNVVRLL